MEDERVLREFMGDRPDAQQLADWSATLRDRLARLKEDAKRATPEEAVALAPKLRRLQEQITALDEEAAITQFVEDSVRVTLAMGTVTDGAMEHE
jgi:hypothetical protein